LSWNVRNIKPFPEVAESIFIAAAMPNSPQKTPKFIALAKQKNNYTKHHLLHPTHRVC
jgi:hypothetical protein